MHAYTRACNHSCTRALHSAGYGGQSSHSQSLIRMKLQVGMSLVTRFVTLPMAVPVVDIFGVPSTPPRAATTQKFFACPARRSS